MEALLAEEDKVVATLTAPGRYVFLLPLCLTLILHIQVEVAMVLSDHLEYTILAAKEGVQRYHLRCTRLDCVGSVLWWYVPIPSSISPALLLHYLPLYFPPSLFLTIFYYRRL